MPTDLPLHIVISQVLQHTPVWVWFILATITLIGVRQAGPHVLTQRRLTLVPVALGAYSLWGACAAFGVHLNVLAAWAAGVALVIAANLHLGWPGHVRPLGHGRFEMAGSVWPLLTMWAVFGVRYVVAVTLALHPDLARGSWFSLAMPVVYGALSGVFAARALRILGTAQAPGALQAA